MADPVALFQRALVLDPLRGRGDRVPWAVRPDDAGFLTDWPGLGLDCVELLLERGVKAVGVDPLSPDVYGDTASPVHRALLGEGVVIVENLAHLDVLPPRFTLLALPLKVKGGSGSPCRAIGLLPNGSPGD